MIDANAARPGSRRHWPRRIASAALLFVLLLVVFWFVLTDGAPYVAARPPPSAAEVGAGRDAAHQLRASRSDRGRRNRVDFGPAQLNGVAALASHGFRPDRLTIELQDRKARIRGSHRLPGGRWLNAGLSTAGGGTGFPPVRLTVGPVRLGPFLSRAMLETGRLLLRLRRVKLPPLDVMVSRVAIGRGRVTATVRLPDRTGVIDGLVGVRSEPASARLTTRIYCELAWMQRSRPVATFTDLIHRAFTLPDSGVTASEYNRAALIALAMLVVDERAGDLAAPARADSEGCRAAIIPASIHGRTDWPKHWILSAALAAGAGTQLSEAMGEWKELADSLSKQSGFGSGDPSGFSFADLSADRSGFRTARAAVDRERAHRTAAWLRKIGPEHLLPLSLADRDDGLTDAEFVRRYGSLSDRRFSARVGEIDRALDQAGVPD